MKADREIARYYFNGKDIPSRHHKDYNHTSIGMNFNNPVDLFIGSPINKPEISDNRLSFKGALDEIYIFNRAITAEEVKILYESN